MIGLEGATGGRGERFFGRLVSGELGLEAKDVLGNGGDSICEGLEEGGRGGKVGGGSSASSFDG